MWHPKGRKSGSDEERIRAPFVGFARCFFRLCLFFFFLFFFFSFFRFVFGLFFSVGFPVGREGFGSGQGGGGERAGGKKRGAEKGGGEGRIRWRDGLVLDAFGLFLFLLVWKDQERVSPLFSGSFRIFFWVNHRFVIRSGPAS